MILQPARVIAVEAHRVRLLVDPPAGCGACLAGRGCGAGLFARLLPATPAEISLPRPGGLDPAAPMALAIEEHALGRQAVFVYAGAVAAFVSGTALATAAPWASGDLPALVTGLAALAAWLGLAHRRAARYPVRPRLVNTSAAGADGTGNRAGG